jgi:hypothetical protein
MKKWEKIVDYNWEFFITKFVITKFVITKFYCLSVSLCPKVINIRSFNPTVFID